MSHTTEIKGVPIRNISALRLAVAALKSRGINVDLVENEIPRMYFDNQIRNQIAKVPERAASYDLNEDPERCDYVLKVHDAFYDVGLLRKKDGSYAPIFDNYARPSRRSGSNHKDKMLSEVIGREFVNADRLTGEEMIAEKTKHEVGQFLQQYTREATVEEAVASGLMLSSETVDEKGECVLLFEDYN